MCPPDHHSPRFLFNSAMRWDQAFDPERAREQWERLRSAVVSAGARVMVVPPAPSAQMMSYVRDAALALGRRRALLLRPPGARGTVEPPLFARWMRRSGIVPEALPRGLRLEGGNVALLRDGRALIGIGPASDGRAERWLARRLRAGGASRCIGIPLAAGRHLDGVLADLDGRGWLAWPGGLAARDLKHASWRAVLRGRPVIEVGAADAARLACNVVCVGGVVIGGRMPARVRRAVERLGLETAEVPLDQFVLSRGGAHCLTLEAG